MAFDPITGEPIENSDDGDMAFDPMTGEPIKKQEAPVPAEEMGGFDPMTGEPLGQPRAASIQQTDEQASSVSEVGGFDPMTGKPLGQPQQSEPVQPAGGFDPMTGKPLGQPQQSEPVQPMGGFDPMTGKPLGQPQQSEPVQPAGGFDPMTGKPLGQPQQSEPVQPMGGFDPMTGKPLGQPQQSEPVQPMGGFDPMTGKPIQNAVDNNKKKSKKIKMPVIIGGAAVVVAVILVIIAVTSGLFLGKAGKVMMATANTFKDRPHFTEALTDAYSILGQNKYTISFSGDMDNVKMSGAFRNGGKEKQLSVQLNQNGSKVDVIAGIDAKNAKFQVPQLSSYLFVYDYNKTSTGYLADELGDDTIEQINVVLESLLEQTDMKKYYSDLFKICSDELKSVTFVNADKEEFTIDDKDVDCKGYTAVITSSNMIHIADKIEKLVNDEYASMFSAMLVADMSGSSSADWKEVSGEMFDELREDLEDMEDIELSFYLYKNKLAGIILRVPEEDAEAELCFEGGDYRMQNMTLKIDDERYRLTGSDDGSKERFTLEERSGSYKQQIGSLEYNYENGKYTVTLAGEVTVSGKLTNSNSEVNLKVNDINAYFFSVSPDLDITLEKGAKMEKLDGKEFDLGKADEDDYMDLIEDIEDKMYDKDLDWITYLF